MKKFWSGKRKCISVPVLTAMLITVVATSIYGASGIDVSARGSITLHQQDDSWAELSAQTYEVPLYRVASVDSSGSYTLTEGFAVDSLAGIASVSSETSADDWNNYAKAAKAAVDDLQIAPDDTLTVEDGTAVASDMELGLYLADVPTVTTDTYEYIADPLLIALPGIAASDDWIYDVSSELKFLRSDRLGDLVIQKTIDSYNTSLGTVSFVFKVNAVKDYAYAENEADPKTVYSNVISMDFTAAGTQSATIADLPAGAKVTVTEVYSGANYSVSGTQSQSAVISANDDSGNPAAVSFTNTYNQTLITGGSAVVNHFTYVDGEWTWNASNLNQ